MVKARKLTEEEIQFAADRAEGKATPDDDTKPKLGRPTEYKPAYAQQASKLCDLGATDEDLADFFNVSIATIKTWYSRHPAFLAASKGGKGEFDDRVERSLAHRALGYSFDAVKIFCNKDGEVTKVPYREHVPPDTTACIFWLKNRRRDLWRDVHKHEVGQPGDFDKMTPDELRNSIARDLAELGVKDPASPLANGSGKPPSELH